MEKTKKMTKRDYYNAILSKYNLTEDEKAFINHELELLDKKNSAEKKPSATSIANNKLMTTILDAMVVGKPYTCSDIIKSVPECSELSTPKVSYLMNALADASKVVKSTDKKKTYFTKG